MKNFITISYICFILLFGCDKHNEKDFEKKNSNFCNFEIYDNTHEISFYDTLIKQDSLLVNNRNFTPIKIKSLKNQNDYFFINDDGKRIFILSGNFFSLLENFGKGPDQYQQIDDFTVSENKIYIYDSYGSIIQEYDYQGKFITQILVKEIISNPESFNYLRKIFYARGLLFFFADYGANLNNSFLKIFCLDTEYSIKKVLELENNEPIHFAFPDPTIFSDNFLIFTTPLNNNIFYIKLDNLESGILCRANLFDELSLKKLSNIDPYDLDKLTKLLDEDEIHFTNSLHSENNILILRQFNRFVVFNFNSKKAISFKDNLEEYLNKRGYSNRLFFADRQSFIFVDNFNMQNNLYIIGTYRFPTNY